MFLEAVFSESVQICFPHSLHSTRRPWPYPPLYQSLTGQSRTSDSSSHASVFFKVANTSVPMSGGNKADEQSGRASLSQAGLLVFVVSLS